MRLPVNYATTGATQYNDNGWTNSTTVDTLHTVAGHSDYDNVIAWYRLGFGA